MPIPLEHYFDFSSPHGDIASAKVDGLAAGYGRAVLWQPFPPGSDRLDHLEKWPANGGF